MENSPIHRRERRHKWVLAASCLAVCMGLCLAISAQLSAQTKTKTKIKPPDPEIDSVVPEDVAKPKSKVEARAKIAKNNKKIPEGPTDYTSRNFLLHTDMPPDEADDLLKRLETMLKIISKYWDRPLSGIIEIYAVKDLRKWPHNSFPAQGLASIENGAGITMSRTISQGNAFMAKSIVYAVADRGTPQHEAVHAYCAQTFGRTGPVWYSEGMAEMGQYWKDGDSSVNAHEIVIDYLHNSRPKQLGEIVHAREVTGDSWQNYAWRWALCHLLAYNPNYAPRFRPLGLGLLTKSGASFDETYGDMAPEINFEYLFFLKHMEKGFRVDLCSWDWKAKFRRARSGNLVAAKVEAARGWQPTRLTVDKGEEYEYSVTGTWSTETGKGSVDADGAAGGAARLVGTVKHDRVLSEQFDLGTYGSFTAPTDGDLYLRCQDKWNRLADNKGKVSVKLKVKNKGNPLQPPQKEPEEKSAERKTKSKAKNAESTFSETKP